jgi:acetyl-CoA hydrolase
VEWPDSKAISTNSLQDGAYSFGTSKRNKTGYRGPAPDMSQYVEDNNLQGKLKYDLFVGASSGAETENRWARNNMINRRSPHQVGKEIAKGM